MSPAAGQPGSDTLAEAERALESGDPRRAIGLAEPLAREGSLPAQVLLGRALAFAGRPGQAERILRAAATRAPGSLPVWQALKQLYLDSGHSGPAAEAMGYEARVHAAGGALGPARALLDEACRLDPDRPGLRHDYGVVCLEMGDPEEAARALADVLRKQPGDTTAGLNMARALERLGRLDQAHDLYGRVAAACPDDPVPARERAWLLKSAGRFTEAETAFGAVLGRWPGDADAAVGLASLLEMRGDPTAARDLLDALPPEAAARPAVALTRARLARRAGHPDRALHRLQAAAGAARGDASLAPRWHFEMAAVLDALGRYADAFAEAAAGHALRPTGWDSRAHADYVDRLIAAFDAVAFSPATESGGDAPLPVFVVGLPRSGTTLVEHLLTRFPDVRPCGERNDILEAASRVRGYPGGTAGLDPGAIGRLRSDYLAAADGHRVLVDKMPVNFLHLGLIARLFPEARIIHCTRDPLDVALSSYFQDFTAPFLGFTRRLEDFADYWSDYQRLMAHWREVLPVPMLDLPYEALTRDPEDWLARIATFLELTGEARDLPRQERYIATNSAAQVRQRISDSAVGRHRHYTRELAGLARRLSREPASPRR